MNRPFPLFAGILLFLLACGEKKAEPRNVSQSTSNADTAKINIRYFPVYSFLKSELDYVDSLPVGIKKITLTGKKKDSAYIKLEEFHKLAGEFISSELDDSIFANEFEESSFFDRGTNTATFLYKAKNDKLLTRRVDVITVKSDIYDEVKSIYIEKDVKSGDSLVPKKLMWKPKKNFQVIRVIPAKNGTMQSQSIKVVWDNRE